MQDFNLVFTIIIFFETTLLLLLSIFKLPRITKRPLFIDTSALIDGRIVSLVEAGLLSNDSIIIPNSVISELQILADSSSSEKRLKARLGLDIVLKLKSNDNLSVKTFNYKDKKNRGVDDQLINLCKTKKGILLTVDYNLIKVAQVENVPIININELAKNLRLAYLPGDKFSLILTQRGNESRQAVGYLDDGTMVVVGNSQNYLGKKVHVECTRSIQTAAGRMIFAKIK